MEYEVVIGLEVHAQLKTETKIFCGCSTKFGDEPNSHGCPVCLGYPGALPVLNKKAVEYALKMAIATNCKINTMSIFARKNYFYPDLPKGYQISQYELPLCEHGYLEINNDGNIKKIGITRIHLEEDAGKLKHEGDYSLFDVNRAGTPLIEIVSEPDIRSPKEAYLYLVKLRQILVYLDICDGNMEEGSLRCDANVSLRPKGQKEFGVKTELKNLNSFRNVERALQYEIERQLTLLENGEKVVQQTLLWDADKNETRPMRTKEDAHDYRYFPDPDLVPLVVDEKWIEKVKNEMIELPDEKIARFKAQYGLNDYQSEVLCASRDVADYFEEVAKNLHDYNTAANWIMTEVLRILKDKDISINDFSISAERLGKLLKLLEDDKISGKIAKQVFKEMLDTDKDPEKIVEEKGLVQITDEKELLEIVDNIIRNNVKQAKEYLSGKEKILGYFVGQLMKATRGKANPQLANKIFVKRINELKDEI